MSLLKKFFVITLVISTVIPLCNLVGSVAVMVHNHYEARFANLDSTETSGGFPGGDLGLTGGDLASVDQRVALAYRGAVEDGYRLGHAFFLLWFESMGLDALLLMTSIFGLWLCRRSHESHNQPIQRAAPRSDE